MGPAEFIQRQQFVHAENIQFYIDIIIFYSRLLLLLGLELGGNLMDIIVCGYTMRVVGKKDGAPDEQLLQVVQIYRIGSDRFYKYFCLNMAGLIHLPGERNTVQGEFHLHFPGSAGDAFVLEFNPSRRCIGKSDVIGTVCFPGAGGRIGIIDSSQTGFIQRQNKRAHSVLIL